MEQESIKNEISLPGDDPKLVRLMLDYLYQSDYEFKAETCNGLASDEEHVPNPESPVAQAIDKFEGLVVASPQEEAREDLWSLPSKSPGKKGKRDSRFGQASQSGLESKSATIDGSARHGFDETELHVHAKVYALADKYGIRDLENVAQAKFADAASRHWNTGSFPLAIQVVYSSTPDNHQGLRDVVINTISKHRELLMKAEVETLVKNVNGLAFGLLESAWGLRRSTQTGLDFGGSWARISVQKA